MAFCSQCGTQLPAEARFCPGCGAATAAAPGAAPGAAAEPPRDAPPPPPPHPQSFAPHPEAPASGNKFVLPVLIVVALGLVAYFLLAPRRPAPSFAGDPTATGPASTPGAAVMPAPAGGSYSSAAALDRAFFNDPRGAALAYPGRVTVNGTIASMVQAGPTPALSMEGRSPFNYMVVNFPAGYRTRLATLAKGQSITVSCGSVTALAGTTILQDCTLP